MAQLLSCSGAAVAPHYATEFSLALRSSWNQKHCVKAWSDIKYAIEMLTGIHKLWRCRTGLVFYGRPSNAVIITSEKIVGGYIAYILDYTQIIHLTYSGRVDLYGLLFKGAFMVEILCSQFLAESRTCHRMRQRNTDEKISKSRSRLHTEES